MRPAADPPLAVSFVACALGGAALSLAFPPAGWWPLAFVAFVPLLWCLRGARPRRGALLGAVFGVVCFGATLYWIWRFGTMAWASLTLLSAASVAMFGLFVPAMIRPGRPWRTTLGVAALWTAVEFVRATWPLGGFTWGTLGVSQVDDRLLLPIASIAGVWGVSFVVMAVNALLVEAAAGGGGRAAAGVRVGLALSLVVAPAAIGFPTADGPRLDVATVQIDVRRAEEALGIDEDIAIAGFHVAAHRTLASDPPDLVVWGEAALDPGATADPATVAAVHDAIAAVGAPTIAGAVTNDDDGGQRTAVLGFDGTGAFVDRYDKVHLVPFGEYVPFREALDWIEALEQIPIDRTPGEEVRAMSLAGLPPIGTPICFENSFPALPRAFVLDGADLLVVPVNNASYGFTAASEQHLQMSRIRAVETGRWVVNAAISGVSAFIDPSGRVVSRTELFETDILRETVRSSTERTPYVRLGDWLPWLSVVIAIGSFLAPRRRPRALGTPAEAADTGTGAVRPRILVILPTFDERPTIERVVRGVLEGDGDRSVLVVDDSSPDGTADVVERLAAGDPRIRLNKRPSRSGLASAYLDGFRLALEEGFDLIVEMDSDLSHDPVELDRLVAGAALHDLTIGSRYVPGGSVTNWSRLRLALSKGGNRYARFMLDLPVHDATSGYRVYRRELLEQLVARPIASEGYGFQVELVLRACDLGADIGEVPITFREREHGSSKISRRIVGEALWLITRWGLAMRLGTRRGSVPAPASP